MKLQCLSFICRRRLKCEIASTYCTLTREQVDSLIPDAKPVFIICLITYGGVVMTMYHMRRSLFLLVKGGCMQMLCSASQVINFDFIGIM